MGDETKYLSHIPLITSHVPYLTSQLMNKFTKDFNTFHYVLKHATKIFLFAHNRPDADTAGSCLALRAHLIDKGKIVDIACVDPYPAFLKPISPNYFRYPDHLDLNSY